MQKQLWLIRHPEVKNNGTQHFNGFYDVGLSSLGIKQANQISLFLCKQNLTRIISTGLKRTDIVARMVKKSANIPWEKDTSLKEMHFGRWDGLSAEKAKETDPEIYDECINADMEFRFPEGESIREFMNRTKNGLDNIITNSNDPVTAIITHSGVMRMALVDLLKLDFQSNWRFRVDYGSLTVLEIYDDYTCIGKINDTCHLKN